MSSFRRVAWGYLRAEYICKPWEKFGIFFGNKLQQIFILFSNLGTNELLKPKINSWEGNSSLSEVKKILLTRKSIFNNKIDIFCWKSR